MTDKKKPDNVVFNTEIQKYDAFLKPYATNVGAPVITTSDTIAWKNRSINKLNHKVQTRYLEIRTQYEKLMQEFEYNNLIYSAKFTFEPIIGEVYHLYKRDNNETFLSIIAPDQCNFNSLGSFYLNTEQIWEKCLEIILEKELTERQLDRIIEMAWEDRTPFEAIKFQFGLPEKEVIKIMRGNLKESSFKRWRKRVNSGVSQNI